MKILRVFIATLALFTIATSTSAMTTAEQISDMDSMLKDRGYYPTDNDDLYDVLDDSSSTKGTMYFFSDKTYAITGVCDVDCSDIDIFVYDKYGELVAGDDDTSALAFTTFKASYTGGYTIKVSMYDCSTEDCYYRVKSYVKK